MPTARELLEQADALMRRNRSPLMDDIPVLTDSVPEVVRRRETSKPSQTAPSDAAPGDASHGPDTIPILTESVETEEYVEEGEAEVQAASPAASSPRAVVDEGDASTWLRTGGEEPSVIGDAPDSIARVPAYVDEPAEEIVVEAPLEVEEAFDEELGLREASEGTAPALDEAVPVADEAEAAPAVASTPQLAEPLVEPSTHPEIPPPPVLAWEDAEEAKPPVPPVAAVPAPAFAIATSAPVPHVVDEAALKAEEAARQAAEEARNAAEEARWASMAEEIRMQVLQRIDLFTDTGLRDQLGARLQPIVDRASADLVATINQHVGDLLRAYVAEAIEREIENWKSNTRGP